MVIVDGWHLHTMLVSDNLLVPCTSITQALARKEEAEREANEAKRRAKLQHSIVEVKDDPSATAPRSEDALETKSHSSEVGKKSSAQQLGLASLRVKTGSGVASPTSNRVRKIARFNTRAWRCIVEPTNMVFTCVVAWSPRGMGTVLSWESAGSELVLRLL